eukprot:SAG31_NODE_615_length_13521_cov_43.196916_10_plen_200_part_00
MHGDAGQAASAPQMSADQRCSCIHAVVAVLPSCYYGIAADSPCSVVAFASGIGRHPAPSDHQGGPSHAWRRWPGRLSASDERGPALQLHTCRGSSTAVMLLWHSCRFTVLRRRLRIRHRAPSSAIGPSGRPVASTARQASMSVQGGGDGDLQLITPCWWTVKICRRRLGSGRDIRFNFKIQGTAPGTERRRYPVPTFLF